LSYSDIIAVEDTMSLIEDLKSKTVFELKSYAKKNNIDLFGVSTKNDILEVIFSFVPKESSKIVVSKPESTEKVAIYSVRNLSWNGVGELTRGYNIVTKEDADKWITNKSVRTASPEEVKRAYGK
jgi:hypothetical protein